MTPTEERARIVSWLREIAAKCERGEGGSSPLAADAFEYAADNIELGAHLPD